MPALSPVECDGKWFGRHGLTVVWSDDRQEVEDMMARMSNGTDTVFIGADYEVWRAASGLEMALPPAKRMTPKQRSVVMNMVYEGLRETAS